MKRRRRATGFAAHLVVVMAGSLLPAHAASPPPPGAVACAGCHGTPARAATAVPGIYGRDASDITAAMTAFRDGTRPATIMNRIAKGFSDDEVRPIAAWLAEQK